MILPICFLAIFVVKLDCVHLHPVQISDEVIDDVWKIFNTKMWPWNTQYSAFFVSNLFAQPPVIDTLLSNTNKIVEPKDIPKFKSQPQQLMPIVITDLKLIDESHHTIVNTKDFKSDDRLLEAVKQINPEFMIEEIVSVPGRHTHTAVKLEKKSKPVNLPLSSTTSPKLVSKSFNFTSKATLANLGVSNSKQKYRQKLSKQTSESTELKTNDSIVKVEATGQTASSGIIPQIPFGSYFLPYLANDKRGVSKAAALILEPHAKAVVGNGGTAVSAPISKAFLKRGIPTNVYFNPESVAIAGVGGKAHAQADLELDLVD
uniref:DUF4774 domain-containing protein n=1 Tax=Bactrocera dorsalis TaxID=27457 RepID=A0A034VZQ3_BACDO